MSQESALQKLRMQKEPAPVQFTPSKAYIIEGHGAETPVKFVVPKNCIVVVKGHPAEARHTYVVREDLQRLCALDGDVLKNPIKYQNEIIKAVGSVLIFTEGMTCPSYMYGLLSKWSPQMKDPSKNNDYIQLGRVSGVIDVDTRMMCKSDPADNKLKLYYKNWAMDNNLIKDFTEMYNGSVFPTQSQIKELINRLGPNATIRTFLESREYNDINWTTQEKLLKDSESGNIAMPGVYYNFVCRETDNSDELYSYQKGIKHRILDPSKLEAHSVSGRTLKRSTGTRQIDLEGESSYVPDYKAIRNQNISEALMRAKELHQYDETSKTPFGMAQTRTDMFLHGKNGTGRKRTKRKKNIRKKKTRKHR
jgi:hypothetical protein